ncbi:MAG TPA: HAD family hydrolase [Ktedonobacterales bacterium]|nr:HAD family hydrolase [Ktedonobacterales bacterium]
MTSLSTDQVVFVLDCDNTLLDNDALKADMDRQLHDLLGEVGVARFWRVYEEVRQSTGGTVDLPQTFAHLQAERAFDDATIARARSIVMDYPFAERLYPAALAVLARLKTFGRPVIVSDGDQEYQPRKIEQSGLAAAVDDQFVVYTHKEDHLDEIQMRWPASYYIMVDDKARILAETKRRLPQRFVTIHVLQGHYSDQAYTPAPDVTLASIGDLLTLDLVGLAGYLAQ